MNSGYKSALIVGAGAGLSASLARLLAKAGMNVALASRTIGDLDGLKKEIGASVFACDAIKPDQVEKLFNDVEQTTGAPDVVILQCKLPHARSADRTRSCRSGKVAYGHGVRRAFWSRQAAARRMIPRKQGAIFFTGASASVKGYPLSAPFAMGKFALRGPRASRSRGNSRHRAFMWRILLSTVASAARKKPKPKARRTPCSTPMPSRKLTSMCCASRAAPGALRSNSVHGWKNSSRIRGVAAVNNWLDRFRDDRRDPADPRWLEKFRDDPKPGEPRAPREGQPQTFAFTCAAGTPAGHPAVRGVDGTFAGAGPCRHRHRLSAPFGESRRRSKSCLPDILVIAVTGAFVYLAAGIRQSWAVWLLIVFCAVRLFLYVPTFFHIESVSVRLLTVVYFVLQAAAFWFAFTPQSRRWFGKARKS